MKTTTDKNENTPPTHIARAGAVQASVWERDTENGVQYKVTITKLFKQDTGWQRRRTFFASELAPVIEAASKAQQWIEYRERQLQFPPEATQP
ncbi:MAG: hypothetical protein ACLQVY_13915 [Limisphaerales bacterium]